MRWRRLLPLALTAIAAIWLYFLSAAAQLPSRPPQVYRVAQPQDYEAATNPASNVSQTAADRSINGKIADVFDIASSWLRDTSDFFDQHSGSFSVIFTAIVAVFTGLLWSAIRNHHRVLEGSLKAARQTAAAAKQTADATRGPEFPSVFLTAMELKSDRKDALPERALKAGRYAVRFTNIGRTPAYVSRISLNFAVRDKLSFDPDYDRTTDMDHLHFIQPNIESDETEVQFIIEPDDVIQDILEKKIRLWAYGYIAFKDFRGDEYRSGFCGYLEGYKENRAFSSRFIQDGPKQYIYHIKIAR